MYSNHLPQSDSPKKYETLNRCSAPPLAFFRRSPAPLPPACSPSSSASSSPLCPHGPLRISRPPFSGEESGAAFTGSRTRGGLRSSPPEICPRGGGYHLASEGLLHQGTDQDGEEEVTASGLKVKERPKTVVHVSFPARPRPPCLGTDRTSGQHSERFVRPTPALHLLPPLLPSLPPGLDPSLRCWKRISTGQAA